MKLGICLAGGGVKGAAHVGALKALEEKNIRFDCISGTSSGSIVASLYSMGYSTEEIIYYFKKFSKKIKYIDGENVKNILFNIIKKHKLIIEGFNSGKVIEETINNLGNIKNIKNIKDINNNLIIASVSLNSGKVYFFESIKRDYRYSDEIIHIDNINIGKAVRASCSYPGVFCPCKFNNDYLVDGGVRENIPWKEMKNISIDKVLCIVFDEQKTNKKDKNIIDSITGSINLMGQELSNYELEGADYVLKIKTKEVSLLDFDEIDYLYNEGYIQMKNFLLSNLFNEYIKT